MTPSNKILITFLVLFLLACGRKDFHSQKISENILSDNFYGRWVCPCQAEPQSKGYYSQYSLVISESTFEDNKFIFPNNSCNSNEKLAQISHPSQAVDYPKFYHKDSYLIKRYVKETLYTLFHEDGNKYLKSQGVLLEDRTLKKPYKERGSVALDETITQKETNIIEYCTKNGSDEVCGSCRLIE